MNACAAFLLLLASAPAQDETLRERGGTTLELRDGVLERRDSDGVRELGCTDREGPGRVLDLAADPAGVTFVVAERGLFLAGPTSEHLDPIELLDGAPPGSPTAVHVDARRRVWLATDEAVGVIEPSFYFGRTLAPELLPGPGPYTLGPGPNGAVRINGAPYAPDAGPPPRVLELRVDGEAWDGDDTLERTYREPIRIGASGEANGGATFRYRLDGHHVWRDLGEELVLDDVAPGNHTLDVIALDRDLNRSAPARIRMRIAMPFYYGKGFVVAVAAITGALVLAGFLLRARSAGGGLWRAIVSTGLVLVLGLEVLAALIPHNKGWPFVGFSMYSDKIEEGDAIFESVLIGVTPNGREFLIPPGSVGVAIDSRWQVLGPIIDGGDAAAEEFLAAYRERFPDRVIGALQVQARRVRITDRGPIPVAPLILSHHEVKRGG